VIVSLRKVALLTSSRSRQVHGRGEHPTRRRLIAAAAKVFSEEGLIGTLLDDVVAEADVTKGAVYHHFANFAELVEFAMLEVFTTDVACDADELRSCGVRCSSLDDICVACASVALVTYPGARRGALLDRGRILSAAASSVTLQRQLDEPREQLLKAYTTFLDSGQARGWVSSDVATTGVAVLLVALGLAELVEATADYKVYSVSPLFVTRLLTKLLSP
jgi:AcrR family transcriptional regulator